MKERFKYEKELYKQGYELLGGIDEAGRGPLYGPVVASMVILPKNYYNEEIKDSKKLSEKQREKLFDEIQKNAISIGIGIVSAKRIDEINILEATKEAMQKAIDDSKIKPDHLLIDAVKLDSDIPSISIIKGDDLSISIASASIIAKVTRDRIMLDENKKYPEYDFSHNKGYGTKKHIEAINKYGVLNEHRKSFNKVK